MEPTNELEEVKQQLTEGLNYATANNLPIEALNRQLKGIFIVEALKIETQLRKAFGDYWKGQEEYLAEKREATL